MQLPIYQVDAFTDTLFKGNPAAVVPLDEWLPDSVMQSIAAENNLAETVYFVPMGPDFEIRWFTPAVEVDLCGHATLASAWVLWNRLHYDEKTITFHSKSGPLYIERKGDWLEMDFPARPLTVIEPPAGLEEVLGAKIISAEKFSSTIVAELENESIVRNAQPDFRRLVELNAGSLIISSRGREADFVSRYFAPAYGIDEDPVTGSAHCILMPYWVPRLGKDDLLAHQVSARGGVLKCRLVNDRVKLAGQAVLYLTGHIAVNL